MEYIVSAAEMKAADKRTSEHFGLSSEVLMERASLAVAEIVERMAAERRTPGCPMLPGDHSGADRSGKPARVLVFAGGGGNGGDGIAVARILHQRGCQVLLVTVGDAASFSGIAKKQLDTALRYGVNVIPLKEPQEADALRMVTERRFHFLVDAIFGVGVSRSLGGVQAAAVALIQRLKEAEKDDLCVLSIDMPSGIHTDTGEVCGIAVRADLTVTMNHRKRGQILYPGASYAGRILVADAGITKESFDGERPEIIALDDPAGDLVPARDPAGNKGSFGKLLIIAGNGQIGGAAILAARGAYAAGAGMVRVFTEKKNRTALLTAVPEALIDTWDEEIPPERMEESLRAALAWANACVIGPGIGTGTHGAFMLRQVLNDGRLPLIIDADGCNLIAAEAAFKEMVRAYRGDETWPVLTPHVAEFARLADKKVQEISAALLSAPGELADALRCTVLCKGARSVAAEAGNPKKIINYAGNSGLATAGSGDVLAGIAGTLAAQGLLPLETAAAACRLHALAGEAAAQLCSEASMTAGDIIPGLKEILR